MQKQTTRLSSDVKGKKPSLKDCFNRTYVLDHSEQYEQFLKELGVKKNVRVRAILFKPRVTLSKEQDEYILTTSFPEMKDVTVKFKIGETIHRRPPGEAVCTSVFYVSDNKLREEQNVDNQLVLIERIFTKKNLTITMEVNDVKCHRFYTVSKSEQSLGTETSRRSSLWTSASSEPEPAQDIESLLEAVLMPETESQEDVC